MYDQARRVISHNDFLRAVTWIDSTASVVFHTSVPFGAPLFKANELAFAEAAMRTGSVKVSGAFKSPINPKSVAAVSVSLRQGTQICCVLRAIILTESVARLMKDAALPEGWVAGVTDSHGTLLARSVSPEAFVGKRTAPSFLEGMRRGDGLPFQGATLEGIRTTIMVLPLHGGDWYLGVAVPDSVLSAALDLSIRRIAAIALLGLGFAFAMSYVFGSCIIRQAHALVEAVEAESSAASAGGTALRVKEFLALLAGVTTARHRETEATGQMAAALLQRDEVFHLYERALCGYRSLDRCGRLVRMNHTALGWLGYRCEELQGRPFTDVLTAESKLRFAENFPMFLQAGHIENVELVLVRKDGSTIDVSISASAVKGADGKLLSSRSTIFDITERKRLEARLDQLARTDTLTRLSNRRDFHERAQRELHRSRRHAVPMAVFMLDIDHFKRINDEHGHDSGDLVLQKMTRVCEASLRKVDLRARIGGEEFAVMLPDRSADRAVEVAERLRQAVASLTVVLVAGQTVTFTVSIGVAMCEGSDAGIEAGLKRADLALYKAKAAGRNQVRVAAADAAQIEPTHRAGSPSGPVVI